MIIIINKYFENVNFKRRESFQNFLKDKHYKSNIDTENFFKNKLNNTVQKCFFENSALKFVQHLNWQRFNFKNIE